MRKNILITIIILGIGAIGASYYFFIIAPQEDMRGEEERGPEDIFFFGENATSTNNISDETFGSEGIVDLGTQAEPYQNITMEPVAGVFVDDTGSTTLRYMRRDTGHIYELVEGEESTKISNTTIPQIQEVFWLSGGEAVALRYVETDTDSIQTFLGTLKSSGAGSENTQRIEGRFLPQNISVFTPSPGGERYFYIVERAEGVEGFIGSVSGQAPVRLFDSKHSDWSGEWFSENTVLLQSKASLEVDGQAFFLNTSTGALRHVLGGAKGLVVKASPDRETLLYSTFEGDTLSLFLYNIENRETTELSIQTIADKCSWSTSSIFFCGVPKALPQRALPDAWYRGEVSFNDVLYYGDKDSVSLIEILDPLDYGEPQIDVVDITLGSEGTLLTLRNKKDLSLWSLRLR